MLRDTLFTPKEEEKATREGFGEALVMAGENDARIVAVCADLTDSVKMNFFRDKFPKRFFELGVTEQAMSGVASGLASMGKIPFMASYAMFSPGRNWEQIRTTICYNNQPVKIIGAHAGVSVGPDGATHQALEDIALMRILPNMEVYVPCDATEAREMTKYIATTKSPSYLRLTRENTPLMLPDDYAFVPKKAYIMYVPKPRTGEFSLSLGLIGCGPILYEAIKAAKELEKEGIGLTVVNMPTVKPFDESFLLRFAKSVRAVVTLEEAQVAGGLGSAISEYLGEHHPMRVVRMGIEDRFGQSGKMQELYEEYGISAVYIAEKVRQVAR